VAPVRLFFSRGASLCYRVLVDRHIATYTAMVRAYRAPTLHGALSDESGFLHVAKTLVEARRHGALVTETPAVLARRRVGVSKAKLARTTRAHLRYLSQIAWLRTTGHFWEPPVAEHAGQIKVAGHG
jgi:dolichol-phosphate mannosyltransferase